MESACQQRPTLPAQSGRFLRKGLLPPAARTFLLAAFFFLNACSMLDPIVADVDYRPPSTGGGGKGKTVALAAIDARLQRALAPGAYGFSPVLSQLRMQIGGTAPSGLMDPHTALRAALKARLEAQGHTVLAPGEPGAEKAPGLIACLYTFEADSAVSGVRRAEVAFSLVADAKLGRRQSPAQEGDLSYVHALAPCAASVGMATASNTAGRGENLDAAFSEALTRAVNGLQLQSCLRR